MSTPGLSTRSFSSRFALVSAFAVVVAGMSLGGAATSAAAACTTDVSDASELATAASDAESNGCTIQPDADITAGSIGIVTSLTLDLHGHALVLGGITSTDGIALTIEDTGSGGTLSTTGSGNFNPGIEIGPDSTLDITSGDITANGAFDAPGIGGTFNETAGNITVGGGTVHATGNKDAAGIGGGESDNAGTYTQTGGTVTATAGPGTDTSGGAGVGGGLAGTSGAVHISGGSLTATGGAGGAGIGSGTDVNGPDVTISGGTVNATGNGGAGIGSGAAYNVSDNTHSGTFTMSAGTVTASSSGGGAGIGGGSRSASGTISVTGGTITATPGDGGAGIGGGEEAASGSISIAGASVTATGTQFSPAIGSGEDGNAGAIVIGTGADVTVSSPNPGEGNTAIGAAVNQTLTSLEIAGTVHVPANNWVVIQSGATATIDSTGVLEGAGTLSGRNVSNGGTVVNNGVIDMGDVWDALRTDGFVGLTITGHDYLETFVPNAADTPPIEGTTAIRLYAPSFAVAGSDHQPPVYAAHPGEVFAGWSNGPTAFTTSTPISADETWTGTWHTVTSLTVSANTVPLAAGHSSQLTVTGSDGLGDSSDQSPWATVTSSVPSDVITNGDGTNPASVAVTKSGSHLLTAHVPINNGDATVSGTGSVTVTTSGTGVPPIGFANAPGTAYVGDTYDFTLSNLDQYGNSISHLSATLKSSSSADSIHGMSVKFGSTGTHTITATSGSHKYTKTVHVIKDTPVVTLSGPSSQTAGVQSSFTVGLAAGASGETPTGTVRLYYTSTKYVSVSVSHPTPVTVNLTLDASGPYSIHAMFEGSTVYAPTASASQPYDIDAAAAVVPNKLVFLSSQTSVVYNVSTSMVVALVDKFGNPIPDSGTGATFTTPDGLQSGVPPTTVRYTTLGHHVITATLGLTSVSKTVNVIKDTPSMVVSVDPLSVPTTGDDFTVEVTTGASGAFVAGNYTFHYGTHTVVEEADTPHSAFADPFGVGFGLPDLKPGKYVFYVTFAGSDIYNAASTPKVTITVSPGPLDHLKFIAPATTASAGESKTFIVDGYDAENNLIGNETSNTTLTLEGASGGETAGSSGAKVNFQTVGARTVDAVDGLISTSTPVAVTHGALVSLDLDGNPTNSVAGATVTFTTAVGSDSYANTLGNLISKVTVTSNVSSDKVSHNKVTMTKAGAHTLTFRDGSVKATRVITVDASTEAPGKFAFDPLGTTTYLGYCYPIQVDSTDKYGNLVNPQSGWTYSSSGSGVSVDQDPNPMATFSKLGHYVVKATLGGITISKTMNVVKDAPTVTFSPAAIPAATPGDFVVNVATKNSALALNHSHNAPTGHVTLHYGTKMLTATLSGGGIDSTDPATATFSLPGLKAGHYSFYATFGGDSAYVPATSANITITVTP